MTTPTVARVRRLRLALVAVSAFAASCAYLFGPDSTRGRVGAGGRRSCRLAPGKEEMLPPGAPHPRKSCLKCDEAGSGSWVSVGEGERCRHDALSCHDGVCGGCVIAGRLRGPDEPDPSNPCRYCRPELDDTTWSNATERAYCGPSSVCVAGVCRKE